MNRRTVLSALGLAGLFAVTGCATQVRSESSTAVPPAGADASSGHPTPTPTATPTPTIDPNEVAARFEHSRPSAWGTALPGIVSELAVALAPGGAPRAALTLDACGGPGGSDVDLLLLDALRESQIPATLFLNVRWIESHPALTAELGADPLFLLANHGTRHRPLSVDGASAYGINGTASAAEAVDEVWRGHAILTELTGHAPKYFRAGTAHYDDVGVAIVHALGEIPIGYSVNGDGGATYDRATVRAETSAVGHGGIVLAHMNQPGGGTFPGLVEAATRLRAEGWELTHVDAATGHG